MSNADERIEDDLVALEGTLAIPVNARAIVVFAHAGGGGRCSPQNRRTAAVLEHGRMATATPARVGSLTILPPTGALQSHLKDCSVSVRPCSKQCGDWTKVR